MAIAVATTTKIQIGAAWTGTAPGGASAGSGTLNTGTDISGFCNAVDVPMTVATQDATTFASGGFNVRVAGLKDGMLTLTLLNDFAASQLDSIIWTLGLGATVYYDVMPTSSARAATNPSYVGAVILTDYKPVAVTVGGIPTLSVSWPTTGWFGRLTS